METVRGLIRFGTKLISLFLESHASGRRGTMVIGVNAYTAWPCWLYIVHFIPTVPCGLVFEGVRLSIFALQTKGVARAYRGHPAYYLRLSPMPRITDAHVRWAVLVFGLLSVAVSEELVFRRLMFSMLESKSFVSLILISALVVALVHLTSVLRIPSMYLFTASCWEAHFG